MEDEKVLIEFIDYECPVCRRQHEEMKKIAADPSITVIYRHFPLSIHPRAELAAEASECAKRQGAFRAMHEALYDSADWIVDGDVRSVGMGAGLDMREFDDCMESDVALATVREERALATAIGLTGTPSFVLRDGVTYGFRSADALRSLLR